MTEERRQLEAHLHAARDLVEKHRAAVREVLELLSKADARRKADPENQRRWDEVLDRLEASLVQARARVAAGETQLHRARRALQEAFGEEAVREAEETYEVHGPEAAPSSTFETRLEKVIGAENAAAALNDEKATEPPADPPAPESVPTTGQQVLQSAIRKIQEHRIQSLSPEEVKATMAAYERLSRNPAPNMKDQRLMRILGAAVNIFQRSTRRKKK